jgi:putative Flp pilus-assembly TadE/G-like protein
MARERLYSERGAVLIQVAVCLLVLLAFSAFVVDYGVMWASRGQVQTAADAGALSGAISMAYETAGNLAAQQTNARKKAQAAAKENFVWGEQPDVDLPDITFPTCPPGAPGPPDTCVKVNAFRNQARDNPLSMFFGNLVGVGEQGVRATATAQIIAADTTECLRPWAVIDRWNEYNGAQLPEPDSPDNDFTGGSTYDKYSTGKGKSPPQEPDLYIPPSAAGPGTGFRLPDDIGKRFGVKTDSNTNTTVSPGWFRAIRIPRVDCSDVSGGGSCYEDNISSCGGIPTTYWHAGNEPCPEDIGQDAAYWASQGCYATETGNMVGPTQHGVEDLIATDPDAVWVGDGPTGYVDNSIYGDDWMKSKRIVPIGVIDIDWFMSQDPSGSNGVLRLVNIFGFFIEGMGDINEATGAMTCCSPSGKAVIGRILTIPGMGGSQLHSSATFLRSIILVR